MNKITPLLFIFTFGTWFVAKAQIFTQPVQYSHASTQPKLSNGRIENANDTLALPFFDDFSNPQNYPDPNKWLPFSNVLVNHQYSQNPPTVGVATFDGSMDTGEPYDFSQAAIGYGDVLESKPIDVGLPLFEQGLVGFSFYWQPGSFMPQHIPNTGDSLILEFKVSDTVWKKVWHQIGGNNIVDKLGKYTYEYIVLDSAYFYKGFQFRFKSYGRISGNFDLWHLDYIYLDSNRDPGDSVSNDVAFAEKPGSFLSPYTTMPLKHFKTNPSKFANDSIASYISNLLGSAFGVTADMVVSAATDTMPRKVIDSVLYQNITGINLPLDPLELRRQMLAPFDVAKLPLQQNRPMTIYYQIYMRQGDLRTQNDTVYGSTEIAYDLGYDDATPEVVRGTSGNYAELALKFTIPVADTLTAIKMGFVKSKEDIEGKIFDLKIWKTLDDNDTSNIFPYHQPEAVAYPDSGEAFVTYDLNRKIPLDSGDFFIGWKQSLPPFIYVGCDINTNQPNRLWANPFGQWIPYTLDGYNLMIRPVFGLHNKPVGIKPISQQLPVTIGPNPVQAGKPLRLFLSSQTVSGIHVAVFDLSGRCVFNQQITNHTNTATMPTHSLQKGLYILKIKSLVNNRASVQKLIVQ